MTLQLDSYLIFFTTIYKHLNLIEKMWSFNKIILDKLILLLN